MSDNVAVTAGTGTTIAADEVVDGTLGTVKVQYVKLMDGTLDGSGKALVSARGLAVDLAPTALSVAKAEDVASADADVGVPAMAIRKATPANTSGTDGDYEMLQVSAGRLWTNTLLGDGTNAVTVKAASTIAAAADPALVVALSPNNTSLVSPGLTATASQTRPADTNAYTAGDVLGTATSVTSSALDFNLGAISASNIMITSVSIERDVAALISGEGVYNLYLYNVTPPSGLFDNAAFDIPSGDRASFLGKIAIGTPVDEGSTLYVETYNINKPCKLAGTHIFGYLVTVGAYTPASATVLKITLNAIQL